MKAGQDGSVVVPSPLRRYHRRHRARDRTFMIKGESVKDHSSHTLTARRPGYGCGKIVSIRRPVGKKLIYFGLSLALGIMTAGADDFIIISGVRLKSGDKR